MKGILGEKQPLGKVAYRACSNVCWIHWNNFIEFWTKETFWIPGYPLKTHSIFVWKLMGLEDEPFPFEMVDFSRDQGLHFWGNDLQPCMWKSVLFSKSIWKRFCKTRISSSIWKSQTIWLDLLEKVPKIFSQMGVNNGDLPWYKANNHQQKQIQHSRQELILPNNPVMWGLFHKPWNKDPDEKHLGFHGKSSARTRFPSPAYAIGKELKATRCNLVVPALLPGPYSLEMENFHRAPA